MRLANIERFRVWIKCQSAAEEAGEWVEREKELSVILRAASLSLNITYYCMCPDKGPHNSHRGIQR